ncbi:MAG: 3,4-dihydroxy-2-butanone-4-phosphate synthase [bacterium]
MNTPPAHHLPEPDAIRHRAARAIEAIRNGGLVVLTDDERDSSEGALVMAGARITPETVNFMASFGGGLVCVALTLERIRRLGLALMPVRNRGPATPAFAVSIEARRGVTTGISAADRARTIEVAVAEDTRPQDLISPGHVFPVAIREGGVLERAAHAEAAADLTVLAGFGPAAVTCAVLGEDGEMARMPALRKLAADHHLPIVSVADVIAWRIANEELVDEVARARLDTDLAGPVEVRVFTNKVNQLHYLTLVRGAIDPDVPTLVRVHSSDVWGDAFTALRRDQGVLLHRAIEQIASAPCGVVLYILKPFTADGLVRKLKSHTEAVEHALGDLRETDTYPTALRDYGLGAQVLRRLGLKKLRLITHNPALRPVGLEGFGLELVETLALPSGTSRPR